MSIVSTGSEKLVRIYPRDLRVLCILGWLTYQFVYLAVSPGSRVRFRITLVILGRPHVFTATKVFIITLIGIYAQSSNNFSPYYELTFWIWFVDFVNWFDYSSAWIVSDNNLEVRSVHQLSMHKGSNPIQSSRWNAKVEWHEEKKFLELCDRSLLYAKMTAKTTRKTVLSFDTTEVT